MIEGSAAPQPAPSPSQRPPPFSRMTEQLKNQLQHVRRWAMPPPRENTDALLLRLRLIERLLWLVLIGLGAYVMWSVGLVQRQPPLVMMHQTGSSAAAQNAAPPVRRDDDDHLKPLAEYRDTLATHNPFAVGARSSIGGQTAEEVKNKLTQLVGALSVVGINRGASPEALIENIEEKHTYFAKVGDTVSGLMIKAIDQRGVVVTYEGEETVLK